MSNRDLLEELSCSLSDERAHLVSFLRALAEFDQRKLYADRAYTSLYAYCCEELKLTRDSAHRRIATARAGRLYPRVLTMIASGELHMSGATKLKPHLTRENHDELLDEARNKSKEAIELSIAKRFPSPAATTSIQPQPAAEEELPLAGRKPPVAPPTEPTRIVPTAETVYTFRFSGSAEAKALLDRAKGLLGPKFDVGEVFERAMTVLVDQLEKRKFKTTDRPRSKPPTEAPPAKRYIADAVKRAVSERDDGCCTFVSEDGRRCRATASLEFDHVQPVARGGASTVSNVRLRCRTHNQHAAEQVFGRQFMKHKRTPSLPRHTEAINGNTVHRAPAPAAKRTTIPKDVVETLRELGFSAKECRRLVGQVRPHMEQEAHAVAWVTAALRASRVDDAGGSGEPPRRKGNTMHAGTSAAMSR